MLLVYFAGHGLLDERTSDLFLALPDSGPGLLHRALRYDDVRRLVMDASVADGKVVILDCCYSGAAMQGGMSASTSMADQARIEGSYLLTASAETKLALAPLDEPLTAFTGELLAALEHGVPDGPEYLDLDTLYWHTRRELEAKGRPVPQQRARNGGRSIALARNRHGHRAAGPPRPAARLVPRPPAGFESVVHGLPRIFVGRVDQLRGDGRDDIAEQLLAAAGASRDDQEVAAVVSMLKSNGQPGDATAMLTAAAHRSPQQVIAIADALTETGLQNECLHLLGCAGDGPPRDIAAIAALLSETGHPHLVEHLLGEAADRNDGPDKLIDLVAALSTAAVPGAHVDAMLRRRASRSNPSDAAEIGDTLRAAGRDAAAYHFYANAMDIVAARPPAEIADLLAAMQDGAPPDLVRPVLDSAIVAARTPDSAAALLDAFWSAGLDAYAQAARERAANQFDDNDTITLIGLLRGIGRQAEALQLCIDSANHRDTRSTIHLLGALHDAGRPIDANRVLDHAGQHWASTRIAELGIVLAATGAVHDLQRLIIGAASSDPNGLLPLFIELDRNDRNLATGLVKILADHRPDDLLKLAEALTGLDQTAPLTTVLLAALGNTGSRPAYQLWDMLPNLTRLAPFLIVDAVTRNADPGPVLTTVAPGLFTDPAWQGKVLDLVVTRSDGALTAVLTQFRNQGFTEAADNLMSAATRRRGADLGGLVSALASDSADPDTHALLVSIARHTSVRDIADLIGRLREAGLHQHVRTILDRFIETRNDQVAVRYLADALTKTGHLLEADYLTQHAPGPTGTTAQRGRFWQRRRS
jgi:hypothetical protein